MPVTLLQVHGGQVGPVDPHPEPPPLPGGAAEIVRFFMEMPQWVQIGGVVVGGVAAVLVLSFAWRHRATLRARIAAVPGSLKVAVLAVALVGGTLGGAAGYRVYDFVEHDNHFCTGCHLMAEAYVAFDESAHNELGCKDCHKQSKMASARQLYLWVLDRPEEVGPHSPVPNAVCASCHIDDDPDRWPQIAASLGHRVHFESDDPDLGELMCVTCHGVSVHEFVPASATCGECHDSESEVRLGRMAEETDLHCVACHDFLADEPAALTGLPEGMSLMPDRAQCSACHAMSGLLSAEELDRDPHGAVCGACHNPHTQDTPADAAESCTGCHERADTLTIFHTGTHAPAMDDCVQCHDAHRWEVEGTECRSCHTSVMGQQAAMGPLDAGDAPGEGRPAPGAASPPEATFPGLGGVRDVRPAADTLPPPPGRSRPFQHTRHETLSCTACHGTAVEHGVVTVRTPRQCAACHHDPGRGYECASCHGASSLAGPWGIGAEMGLTVWETPRPRTLPFDHDLHGELTCTTCHSGPVLLQVETTCATCHEEHHRAEADCSSCHRPAPEGTHGLEVHLTCSNSGCHAGTVDARPTLSRSLCLTCHADQVDHEPGMTCHECHLVPERPWARGGAS